MARRSRSGTAARASPTCARPVTCRRRSRTCWRGSATATPPRAGSSPRRWSPASRSGRSAAQLLHWQKEAVHRASDAVLCAWARGRVPPGREAEFTAAVRANLVLPADAAEWGHVVYGELPCAEGEVRAAIAEAGPEFFATALAAVAGGDDYARLVATLKAATGRSGRALFRPLRAALTQRFDGPELARLLAVIPAPSVTQRLEAARALAAHAPPGRIAEC